MTGKIQTAEYRVSKRVFFQRSLNEDERKIGEKLDPYMKAISNLHIDHITEDYQINNYGLGGQYEFHHDYGKCAQVVTVP